MCNKYFLSIADYYFEMSDFIEALFKKKTKQYSNSSIMISKNKK